MPGGHRRDCQSAGLPRPDPERHADRDRCRETEGHAMMRLGTVGDLPSTCDLAVVGAGPAGLAAAAVAAAQGLHVIVFDENAEPGGQIYRGLTSSPSTR